MSNFDKGLGGIPGQRDEEYRRGEHERQRRQDEERSRQSEIQRRADEQRKANQRILDGMGKSSGAGWGGSGSSGGGGSSGRKTGAGGVILVGAAALIGLAMFGGNGSSDPSSRSAPESIPEPVPADLPPSEPMVWSAPLPEGKVTQEAVFAAGLQIVFNQTIEGQVPPVLQKMVLDSIYEGVDFAPTGQPRLGTGQIIVGQKFSLLTPALNSGPDLRRALVCEDRDGQVKKLLHVSYDASASTVRVSDQVADEAGNSIILPRVAAQSANCQAAFGLLTEKFPTLQEVRVMPRPSAPGVN